MHVHRSSRVFRPTDRGGYDSKLEAVFYSCDEDPTTVESDNYCQDTRPDSWRQVSLNGESYFYVPLAGFQSGVRNDHLADAVSMSALFPASDL